MYKNTRKCCVPNCNNVDARRHRFPSQDAEVFKLWVKNINNNTLKEFTQEYIVKKGYLVCDTHFADNVKEPWSRSGLMKNAVPTLNLPSGGVQILEPLPSCSKSQEISVAPNKPREFQEHVETSETGLTTISEENRYSEQSVSEMRELVTPTKRSFKRNRILHQVQCARQSQLTPKCKEMYKMVTKWSRNTYNAQRKVSNLQSRLNSAQKVAESASFLKFMRSVNAGTYLFINMQVRTQSQKPKLRRFTIDEKILSSSLLKSSSKGYKLLAKIFALPSKRTLSNLLNKIPFGPGKNEKLLSALKEKISKMSPPQKCCSLIFDEIALGTGLSYNKKEGLIEGLEDFGNVRRKTIADHANICMLKGVYDGWKQPISFTFSGNGGIKTDDLYVQLKENIRWTQQIGLKVVSVVCDQVSSNAAAVNRLLREYGDAYSMETTRMFTFNGQKIVVLFDIPHIFKCLRNNFLTKDIHFEKEGIKKIAKWKDVEDFYYLDTADSTRLCPKLSDAHILPAKMNKMKVKLCTQIFSHQVGSLMMRISQWDIQAAYKLEPRAKETAELILFFDKLFDSLNGNNKVGPATKPLKGALTEKSGHLEFWVDAKKIISTIKFVPRPDKPPPKKKQKQPPSTKNLIRTINGFKTLQINLRKENFKYILPRAFNQDPLENFFGMLRSHGSRNIKPNIPQFVSSLKSLIVNNFMAYHSPGFNCEEDVSKGALDNMRTFLTGEVIPGVAPLDQGVYQEASQFTLPDYVSRQKKSHVAECVNAYIAGYIIKKISKITKGCQTCKNTLTHSDDGACMDVIEARQYSTVTFYRPGTPFKTFINNLLSKLFYYIPRLCNKPNISKLLLHILKEDLIGLQMNCPSHTELSSDLIKTTIDIVLYFWTKRINQILRGKDSKFVKLFRENPNNLHLDPVKVQAHKIYLRNLKNKSNK